MKYALIISDIPKADFSKSSDGGLLSLCNFEDSVSQILTKDENNLQRLGLGVYLIALEKTLPAFSDLLYSSQRLNIPLRVLFLDEKPSWFTSIGSHSQGC